MKITVNTIDATKPKIYPCVGIYPITETVVLFTNINSGIVLRCDDTQSYLYSGKLGKLLIGEFAPNWIPCDITITH